MNNTMTWDDFLTILGDKLDQRRRQQEMFRGRQFASFIVNCSHLLHYPGSADANSAMAEIKEEGTFKLVADSVTEFTAMFPGTDSDAEPTSEEVEEQSEAAQNTPPRRSQPAPDQHQLRPARNSVRSSFRG